MILFNCGFYKEAEWKEKKKERKETINQAKEDQGIHRNAREKKEKRNLFLVTCIRIV